MNLRTDGEYLWYEHVAYYVETYGFKLPHGLVARAIAGDPPSLDKEERARIIAEISGPSGPE